MTPPLDEEENKEPRVLEAQARKELENEGCPPCYPPDLAIPLHSTPEKYQVIIRYGNRFQGQTMWCFAPNYLTGGNFAYLREETGAAIGINFSATL